MAKGRRLTASRSERLLGVDSYNNNYGHVQYNNVSEFVEEDMWSFVEHVPVQNDDRSGDYGGEWTSRADAESGRRRGVVISQSEVRQVGGLSLAFDDETAPSRRIVHQFGAANNAGGGGPRIGKHMATSAPVNVPDWSKILRVDSAESMHDSDDDDPAADSDMEPPHEYLARSRKMNAFSVYEGVGRTLKGRDLSRVRDAVWSQTGFAG